MGVLDDAIREHIELQRLHGASEDDLRRQESEALGPARRETPKPAEEAPDGPAAEVEEEFDRQQTQVMQQPDPDAFHEAPAPAEAEHDEPFAEPAAEGEVVDAEFVEEEVDEEDVLEETPEFLQETPEHDRLWFEQKPPRDFDL